MRTEPEVRSQRKEERPGRTGDRLPQQRGREHRDGTRPHVSHTWRVWSHIRIPGRLSGGRLTEAQVPWLPQ